MVKNEHALYKVSFVLFIEESDRVVPMSEFVFASDEEHARQLNHHQYSIYESYSFIQAVKVGTPRYTRKHAEMIMHYETALEERRKQAYFEYHGFPEEPF